MQIANPAKINLQIQFLLINQLNIEQIVVSFISYLVTHTRYMVAQWTGGLPCVCNTLLYFLYVVTHTRSVIANVVCMSHRWGEGRTCNLGLTIANTIRKFTKDDIRILKYLEGAWPKLGQKPLHQILGGLVHRVSPQCVQPTQ